MMVDVEQLRDSRSIAPVKFKEFTTLFNKFGTSTVYFMFEGEDVKYYGIRIDTITRPQSREYLNCEGKEEVLRFYRIIQSQRDLYGSARIAYFVDRDFDISIYNSKEILDIYETPCYSIENFYTSLQAFQKILEGEFGLTKNDEDFSECSNIFVRRQKEFHNETKLLNAWVIYQKRQGVKLNLKNFTLKKYISVGLDIVSSSYDLETFRFIYPDLKHPSEDSVQEILKELDSCNFQSFFRGKFEIFFLYTIVSRFVEASSKGDSGYFTSSKKINLNPNEKNVTSLFSQYADTPSCLINYLESFRHI